MLPYGLLRHAVLSLAVLHCAIPHAVTCFTLLCYLWHDVLSFAAESGMQEPKS